MEGKQTKGIGQIARKKGAMRGTRGTLPGGAISNGTLAGGTGNLKTE